MMSAGGWDVNYQSFLESKRLVCRNSGKDPTKLNSILFEFQNDLTKWAIKKGRCAIFADTGLGKTLMQLEWARAMGEKALIIAPLSVARQTVREAESKLSLNIEYAREQSDAAISITNYEMIDHFDASQFGAVVLDESSILKGLAGKMRRKLTEMFANTPYKLCCTATPAPNDIAELANHAEFLGIMSRTDMLSTFFVHDDEGWRLRGHAKEAFFRWLSSWGMFLRLPSDLGYSDKGYKLPPLNIEKRILASEYKPAGQLFAGQLKGIADRSSVRKSTIGDKLQSAIDLISDNAEQWIIWCGLNDEATKLAKAIPESVNVQGSDSLDKKKQALEDFQDGKLRVLITKPKIGGFGINLQNCHNQIFFGLNDSWETFYQCIRRSFRFGQSKEVNVYVLISDAETEILRNVLAKDRAAESMRQDMIAAVRNLERLELSGMTEQYDYQSETIKYRDVYKLMLGDCIERIKEIDSDSIGLSVFSPPFLSLYAYSPTERDIGNSRGEREFFDHFGFLIPELLRTTKAGRNCCVHVSQVPAMLVRDGYIGLKDFRGKVIGEFERRGWVYHGEICIDKDPQAQAIRTHSKALMFTQLKKDSSWLRPALADFVLVFRKPGENGALIKPDISNEQWIEWARPIWYGINETKTLNYREARENDDDRHICPLQLDVIERCVKLWSNEGDLVLSPFAGIGSEGFVAVKEGRRFIGIELKKAYFDCAARNLKDAVRNQQHVSLFNFAASL